MIFISLLILIVAIALPSINKNITPILYSRISAIVFIYAGALSLNALYIQSIGSGIGIYSGLFHVTAVSQLLDTFIFIIGSLILISWPSVTYKQTFLLNNLSCARQDNKYNILNIVIICMLILILSSSLPYLSFFLDRLYINYLDTSLILYTSIIPVTGSATPKKSVMLRKKNLGWH